MLEDKTKIIIIGKSKYILIPYSISVDSNFQFDEKDNLIIKNKGDKLIIGKVR